MEDLTELTLTYWDVLLERKRSLVDHQKAVIEFIHEADDAKSDGDADGRRSIRGLWEGREPCEMLITSPHRHMTTVQEYEDKVSQVSANGSGPA